MLLCVVNFVDDLKFFRFKSLENPVAVNRSLTSLFELTFVGSLELLCVLKDFRGVFARNYDNAVRVSKNNVAGVDADSAAGNRNVDFARTFLVGAAGCCSGAVNGEISFSYLVNVAYRAVKDYSCDFFLKVQISHHYFTHKGAC